jgi:hypothetical protein
MLHQTPQQSTSGATATKGRSREDVFTQYRPAVLRGLVKDWPAVKSALSSPTNLTRYLAALTMGNPVDAILMPPEACGRISYNDAMDGFNFVSKPVCPYRQSLNNGRVMPWFENSPAVAVQRR